MLTWRGGWQFVLSAGPKLRTNASQKNPKQTTRTLELLSSADSSQTVDATCTQLKFRARTKLPSEDWGTFADSLKLLADKALPDLDEAARERLAVDRFLSQIADPQLSFSVRQKQPATIDDALAATLELQAHLQLASTNSQSIPIAETSISAVVDDRPRPTDRTADLLQKLITRMDTLESQLTAQHQQLQPPSTLQTSFYEPRAPRSQRRPHRPVVCFNCDQPGHFARGCAALRKTTSRPQQNQGN